MAEGKEAALSATKELKSNRILGDMDFYAEQLTGICNSLRESNDGIFGSGPTPALEDTNKAENCFLAQRDEKHQAIVRLFEEVQDQVHRLKDF